MGTLTKAQRAGLEYISGGAVCGPGPGWNASIWIADVCDGDDLAVLFGLGLVTAAPKPPPHFEDFDEDAGSIKCDHFWSVTDAGREALLEGGE